MANRLHCLERGYRHYGDRNRCAYRKSGSETEVGVCSAKNDTEQNAEEGCFEREFGCRLTGRNIGWLSLVRG